MTSVIELKVPTESLLEEALAYLIKQPQQPTLWQVWHFQKAIDDCRRGLYGLALAAAEKILATDIAEHPWNVDPDVIREEVSGTTLETLRTALDAIKRSATIQGANFGQLEVFRSWVKKQ